MVLIKQVFTLLPSGRDLLSTCVRSYSSLMVFCDGHLLDTQSVSYPESSLDLLHFVSSNVSLNGYLRKHLAEILGSGLFLSLDSLLM